jgi:hypothetical protein
MPQKATSTRIVPAPKIRRTRPGKGPDLDITSQSIASDLVAFRKQGGRIEVLGNTPLRPNATAFSSKGNTAHKTAARKSAARATTAAQNGESPAQD